MNPHFKLFHELLSDFRFLLRSLYQPLQLQRGSTSMHPPATEKDDPEDQDNAIAFISVTANLSELSETLGLMMC